MEVGPSPGDFVLYEDPASSPKKGGGAPPQFSAHVYCGQTTGWIKMPLGMEVGLGPGDFVFDGPKPCSSPEKGHNPHPIFGPCLLWPNGWMDQYATWYGSKPRPRRRCVRWGRSPPSSKRGTLPCFRSMSIVTKRMDGLRRHLVRK